MNNFDLTACPQDQIDRLSKKLAGFGRRYKGESGRLYKELAKTVRNRDNAGHRAALDAMHVLNGR